MFTGIVKGRARVADIQRNQGLYSIRLAFPSGFDDGLELGASVAVDGVCLLSLIHISEPTRPY